MVRTGRAREEVKADDMHSLAFGVPSSTLLACRHVSGERAASEEHHLFMSASLEIPHTCAHKREYVAHFHGIRGNDPRNALRSLGEKHQMWRKDQSFFLKRNLET